MLRQQGFEVLVASTAKQLKDIIATETVSTAIVSMELADQEGVKVIEKYQRKIL